MRSLLIADATVFATAFVVTLAVTPLATRLARRVKAIAPVGDRTVHAEPTPVLGGAAMLIGFIAALVMASATPALRPAFITSLVPAGVVLAALVLFGVGLLDDLRPISPPAKVAGQVLAAGVLFLLGVTMVYFRIPFAGFIVLSNDMAPLVTAIWVVLYANAINLIDGLDGLAAGICAIAGGALFLYGIRLQQIGILDRGSLGPVICVAVVGICLGFLPWNFHPARIFMGDSGAMMLGLLLAASTMLIGGRTADQFSGQTFFFFAPLVIPLVILGVPILDTAFSLIRRLASGRSPSEADKEHLHHRLLALGHGHRRAVLMLYAWTALLAGVTLVPTYTGRGNAVVPFALAGLALFLYAVFHPGGPHRIQRSGPGKHVRREPVPTTSNPPLQPPVTPSAPEGAPGVKGRGVRE